jgi:hypothetical protein
VETSLGIGSRDLDPANTRRPLGHVFAIPAGLCRLDPDSRYLDSLVLKQDLE